MNADSHLDLAVSRTAEASGVKLLLGDGLGGFSQQPEVAVGEGAISLAGADFNEDGNADLVTPSLWPSLC